VSGQTAFNVGRNRIGFSLSFLTAPRAAGEIPGARFKVAAGSINGYLLKGLSKMFSNWNLGMM